MVNNDVPCVGDYTLERLLNVFSLALGVISPALVKNVALPKIVGPTFVTLVLCNSLTQRLQGAVMLASIHSCIHACHQRIHVYFLACSEYRHQQIQQTQQSPCDHQNNEEAPGYSCRSCHESLCYLNIGDKTHGIANCRQLSKDIEGCTMC